MQQKLFLLFNLLLSSAALAFNTVGNEAAFYAGQCNIFCQDPVAVFSAPAQLANLETTSTSVGGSGFNYLKIGDSASSGFTNTHFLFSGQWNDLRYSIGMAKPVELEMNLTSAFYENSKIDSQFLFSSKEIKWGFGAGKKWQKRQIGFGFYYLRTTSNMDYHFDNNTKDQNYFNRTKSSEKTDSYYFITSLIENFQYGLSLSLSAHLSLQKDKVSEEVKSWSYSNGFGTLAYTSENLNYRQAPRNKFHMALGKKFANSQLSASVEVLNSSSDANTGEHIDKMIMYGISGSFKKSNKWMYGFSRFEENNMFSIGTKISTHKHQSYSIGISHLYSTNSDFQVQATFLRIGTDFIR